MFVTYPALEAMPFLQETKLTHALHAQLPRGGFSVRPCPLFSQRCRRAAAERRRRVRLTFCRVESKPGFHAAGVLCGWLARRRDQDESGVAPNRHRIEEYSPRVA